MRLRMIGYVLVSLLAVPAQGRRLTPGVAFTATLQSGTTGATATMTWRTHRNCSQFQLLGFRCVGRWDCEGAACPGRRGFLAFIVDRSRYDKVMLTAGRHTTCLALPLAVFMCRVPDRDGDRLGRGAGRAGRSRPRRW